MRKFQPFLDHRDRYEHKTVKIGEDLDGNEYKDTTNFKVREDGLIHPEYKQRSTFNSVAEYVDV